MRVERFRAGRSGRALSAIRNAWNFTLRELGSHQRRLNKELPALTELYFVDNENQLKGLKDRDATLGKST